MNIDEALRIVGRQRPCEHENHDTRFGDGTTWAKCENCGAMFDRSRLADIQKRAERFDAAMEVLRALREEGGR